MKKYKSFLCTLLALLLLIFPAVSLYAASPGPYQGIDVSEWQGSIDFQAVADSGIEVVYIRAGEGADYTDAYFEEHYQEAEAAGLSIGFYHYVTATNTQEAREQAMFFYSLIEDKSYDCLPAMDFESFGPLSNEEINRVGMTFLETLATQLGYAPAIYSDSYNAANLWDNSFTAYPLWVANYGVSEPESIGAWSSYSGFQYSDTGSVNGISGNVDLDYFSPSIFISQSTPSPDGGGTYTVKSGDTLWGISQQFHTTVARLVSLNHIVNPDLIYPGQVLLLPQEADVLVYRVKPGDTLWSISRRFGTSVQALVRVNHIINPNLIYAGQTLTIPR